MSAEPLEIVVEQTAPLLLRPEENGKAIREAVAAAAEADFVVFPELALTGYLVDDQAPGLAVETEALPVQVSREGPALVLGYIERARNGLVYNAAAAYRGADILARHRKIYLPTYGIFDEGRTFAPGRKAPPVFELGGWRIGLLICEELWHPALPYLLALREVDLILVLSSAPGRGEPEDREGALFGSTERWRLLARAAAFNHGVWVVLVNRAGVEEELTFAGGSLVVAPDGRIFAQAPEGQVARLEASLDRRAVTAARHAFSHLRDENPALVLRELRALTSL